MRALLPILIIAGLAGCAGKGESIPVHLKGAMPAVSEVPLSQGLKVTILPFEDKRSEKARLGRRTHLWGGESYFVIADGRPEETVAKIVADYLTRKGWKATVATGGSAPAPSDLTITGQINDLSANVKSGVAHTDISVKSQILMQTTDVRNGNTSRMTLNGERTRTVFWFDDDDVEEELNQNLEESLNRLIADARANELLPVR
ncbi:MAG TPA: YajG family lipoprotein [Nitrospirales bacterium]|nr:YajG family lipoprotein [Nitrospirales bacterium]